MSHIQNGGGSGGGRTVLTVDLNLYVSTTGSDSNNGLTTGTAFATVQHALNLIAENYFLYYANVFVHILAGSGYDGWSTTLVQTAIVLGLQGVGGLTGFVFISGDTSDNTAVTISGTNGFGETHFAIAGALTPLSNNTNFYYSMAAVSFDSLTIDTSKYESACQCVGPNVNLFLGGGYINGSPSSGIRFLAGGHPILLNYGSKVVIDTALFFEAGSYPNAINVDNDCSVYVGELASITAENGATWTDAFIGLDNGAGSGLVNLLNMAGGITDHGAVGPKFGVSGPNALLVLPGDLNSLPGSASGFITNGGSVIYISDVDSNFYSLGANCTETFTVATLPAAPLAYPGMRAFVSDATAPVFGAAPVGTGLVYTPVIYLNGAWQVG